MDPKHQQILALAESFIRKELNSQKVKQYERLRHRLQMSTPSKSPSSTHFLSSSKKTHHSRTLIQSNTERKQLKSVYKKSLQPLSDSRKAVNVFLENVISDLASIREKILRREYTRKSMKQIDWKTKESLGVDETVVGEMRLSLERIALALDIQTLKVKEETSKTKVGGEAEIGKVHKDNKWLIEQVESLVEENERLKGQGAGFIKHRK